MWPLGLRVATFVVAASFALGAASPHLLGSIDPVQTISYGPLFLLGILLALHRGSIVKWYSSFPVAIRAGAVALSLLLFSWPTFMPEVRQLHSGIGVLMPGIGVTILMLEAQIRSAFSGALEGRVIQFLGRISYSVYLLQFPTIELVLHTLEGRGPLWLHSCVAAVATLLFATVSYYLVELKGIKVGRVLASRLAIWTGPMRLKGHPPNLDSSMNS
jgi:peptidoglycan/LPS O-acetylase OafA/YrhL